MYQLVHYWEVSLYLLTLAVILPCQKWNVTENEGVNPNF